MTRWVAAKHHMSMISMAALGRLHEPIFCHLHATAWASCRCALLLPL
jgi:hypothetical protein